jgi:hypothetical protein
MEFEVYLKSLKSKKALIDLIAINIKSQITIQELYSPLLFQYHLQQSNNYADVSPKLTFSITNCLGF